MPQYGISGFGYEAIGNLSFKSPVTFTHDPVHVHQVKTGSDGSSYEFDAKGNLLREVLIASGSTRTFTYDYENRLVGVVGTGIERSATLGYDLTGARIRSTGSYGTYTYAGPQYRCQGSSCNRYVFLGSTLVAAETPTGRYYFHPDHLGSTRVVTNASGLEAERLEYDADGSVRSDTGLVGFAEHRFTGQVTDPSTGLYYYNARFYHPRIGRFLTPDSFVQDPLDAQSLNRYAYARGNPALYTDPSGHFIWETFVGAIAPLTSGPQFLLGAQVAVAKAPVRIACDALDAAFLDGGLDPTNPTGHSSWRQFDRDLRKHLRSLDPKLQGSDMQNALMVERGFWHSLVTQPLSAPQNYLGYRIGSWGTGLGLVEDVEEYKSALVLDWKFSFGGFTLGDFISVGAPTTDPDLVPHEYGHVKQSRKIGPLYLPFVAIPSLISASVPWNNHNLFWTEVWANQLGRPLDESGYPRRYRSEWWRRRPW